MSRNLRHIVVALVLLASLLGFGPAFAAQSAILAKPVGRGAVERAVAAYAKKRGLRPEAIRYELGGLTASGKSTRATLHIGGRESSIVVNHTTGRVQARDTAALVDALLASHMPLRRAETGDSSRFATMLVDFRPGEGAALGRRGLGHEKASPLGRPRAGQTPGAQALDSLSLGTRGAITLALGREVVAGTRAAGIRVRENGFGDQSGTIINQTPGLVEVMVGNTWHRLGYAGYRSAGDTLLLANAIDPIPHGVAISLVRVTDAQNAPHPNGIDPTDDAVATARGVKGFDLVSVEGVGGK